MDTKTFDGTVVNGMVRLPVGVNLPDDTHVLVTVTEPAQLAGGRVYSPRLAYIRDVPEFEFVIHEAASPDDQLQSRSGHR